MRPIDLDELIPQLNDKVKEMKDMADQCKGDAINYYNGVKYGLVKAAIFVNGFPTIPIINSMKYGKWIKMSDADGVYWACSECGEGLPRVPYFDPQFDLFPRLESIVRTNYCPHCGAKMGGSEDGET